MVVGCLDLLIVRLWLWFMVAVVVVARVFYLFNAEVVRLIVMFLVGVVLFACLLLLDFTCVDDCLVTAFCGFCCSAYWFGFFCCL